MIFQFVKTNILSKKLRNFLAIFSIAISVMLIISIQNVTEQLNSNIVKNASYYDIIVGAPGSETELILSTLFYYDSPRANIDIDYYENLKKDIRLKSVVPIGMGDNYAGYKMIGTSTNFFEDTKNYTLKEGKIFGDEEGEVVLGSTAAKMTGLKIGDTFHSSHGLIESSANEEHHHENLEYKVVGILEPTRTPNDTVIFTAIENLWHVHGLDHAHEEGEDHDHEEGEEHDHEEGHEHVEGEVHEDEHEEGETHEEKETVSIKSHSTKSDITAGDPSKLITALLIRSKGLSEQFVVSNELGKDSNIQVLNPTASLRKLMNTLDIGGVIVTIVAYISVVLAAIMLFTTMLSSSLEKMKDISILRALGANRKTVFSIILLEAMVIAIVGAVIGFIIAHLGIMLLGNFTAAKFGLDISGFMLAKGELVAILITIILSLLAGMVPGMMVYKADATKYIK